jgi:hypothetical protein
MNVRNRLLGVEALEVRSVPAGFGFGGSFGGWWGSFTSSPAVQADLTKIHTDTQTLHTDLVNLAPTLQKDQKAVHTATTAAFQNDASVMAAQTTLKTEFMTSEATFKTDWQAIHNATSQTARTAAFTQLKSDASAAATAIQTDRTALQTALNNDGAVAAAQAQLKTDSAPITADKATLQADYEQLQKDLQAQSSSKSVND